MKRLLCLILCVCLVVCAGCAGAPEKVDTPTTTAPVTTTAPTVSTPTEPEEELPTAPPALPPEQEPTTVPPSEPAQPVPPTDAPELPVPPSQAPTQPPLTPPEQEIPLPPVVDTPAPQPVPPAPGPQPIPIPTTPPVTEPSPCQHDYRPTSSLAPSCTIAGYQAFTCSKCAISYQDTLPPLGHSYTDATCTAPQTCSICAATQGEPLPHSYDQGSCSRCGDPDPDYAPELTVFLRGNDGVKLQGIGISWYNEAGTLLGTGVTDGKGLASIAPKGHRGGYQVKLSQLPKGYTGKDTYTFTAYRGNITLTAVAVIDPEDHSKAQYKEGKTMGDFSLTDTEGKTYALSELLSHKKVVILNFWYCACIPCKEEFPYFEALYRDHQKDVEILAVNHFDSRQSIQELKTQMGLTFPMLQENINLWQGFGVVTYPVTVIINSQGTILRIRHDPYTSEAELRAAIEPLLQM